MGQKIAIDLVMSSFELEKNSNYSEPTWMVLKGLEGGGVKVSYR